MNNYQTKKTGLDISKEDLLKDLNKKKRNIWWKNYKFKKRNNFMELITYF